MTESPADGLQDEERIHSEDPAEGARGGTAEQGGVPREHTENPAEGADDESAVS